MIMDKILVIEIAGLGYDFFLKHNNGPRIGSLEFQPIKTVFPAVTCTVQASFRTGELPAGHGIVGNGFYSREVGRSFFWEQSSLLLECPKIWDAFRCSGKTVGQLFWQQSLGLDSDLLLSPAPIHKHHGGMIQDCYARPSDLYASLKRKLGRAFNLKHYWGPLTSIKSSEWITEATIEVMQTPAPDLLLTYLPHLDYELQKSGPYSKKSAGAYKELKLLLEKLLGSAEKQGYDVVVFGDYAMQPVNLPVFPNLLLREEKFFSLRAIKGMTYPDFHSSKAFAIVDHQIAHIIIKNDGDIPLVKKIFQDIPGIATVLDEDGKKDAGLNHRRAGELILIARQDAWFAYHWWKHINEAPDYAKHVDIHSKPGYEPCELFFGKWPFFISTDCSKVKGSHGRLDKSTYVAWSSSMEFDSVPKTLIELSNNLKTILNRRAAR